MGDAVDILPAEMRGRLSRKQVGPHRIVVVYGFSVQRYIPPLTPSGEAQSEIWQTVPFGYRC
jgi:hypothetical protein